MNHSALSSLDPRPSFRARASRATRRGLALAALLAAAGAGQSARAQAPAATAVNARIASVTVYAHGALVQRRGELPGGNGHYVIEGLPAQLDASSVRVRTNAGVISKVEAHQRVRPRASNARVQELNDALRAAERELQGVDDQMRVQDLLEAHVTRLLEREREAHRAEIDSGRPNTESWQASYEFAQRRLNEGRTAKRTLAWQAEDLKTRIADLQRQIGDATGNAVQVHDVHFSLSGVQSGPVRFELDAFLHGAGWNPLYDLRADGQLKNVGLEARASVRNSTGEDWSEVELLLSTAQPHRGAQGPDPIPQWVGVLEPGEAPRQSKTRDSFFLGRTETAAAAGAPALDQVEEVTQEASGLSVRYRLPRPETVQSRDAATEVLITSLALPLQAERVCVPALDTTVWMRGKAKNASEWTFLPGRTSVYFGADFVGNGWMDIVRPNEEIALHLGPDQGISVERIQLEGQRKDPGFMSSKQSLVEGWKITIENMSAAAANADGSVDVIVREVLPRSRDSRVTVSLEEAKPEPSKDARWTKEREEQGFLTWVVRVPKGGKSEITWRSRIAYPEKVELQRF